MTNTCARPMVTQHAPCPPGTRKHLGRGLCDSCYSWAHRYGHLENYSRKGRPTAVVAEEHAFLAGQGLSNDAIAARLDMTTAAMERALYRHRAGERAA